MKNGWKKFGGGYSRLAAVLFVAITAVTVVAADWPCYRGDARRDAISPEQLEWPLQLLWTHTPAQAPAPAWPEPGREAHRINFDYAFHPVVAGGLVFYGSSADDTVRALDLKTGRQKWRFTTGAPVRFAPHVADGRCYFASDDGFAYCVNAATGALVWQFQAAPEERQLSGNGRMISRWPCRSGVLVLDGVAYVAAGMWPSEGVYIYALDAATGKQIWRNDTSGSLYVAAPHEGAFNMGGVAPQGYLLATDDLLLVPTGRNRPAFFDRKSGKLVADNAGEQFGGNAEIIIIGGTAWVGGEWARQVSMPRIGEAEKFFCQLSFMTGPNLSGKGSRWKDDTYRAQAGNEESFWFGAKKSKFTVTCQTGAWSVPCPYAYASAVAGKQLLIGCEGKVLALDRAAGKEAGSVAVAGQARGIAVADGRLLVATEKGTIQCFGSGAGHPAADATVSRPADGPPPPISLQAADLLKRIKGAGLAGKGYALVIGAPDAGLAEALAAGTKLTIIAGLADPVMVKAERDRLLDSGTLHGSRVSIQHIGNFARLPFAQFFADVVVVCAPPDGLSGPELYRILAPCGGLLMFEGAGAVAAAALIASAGIPALEVRRAGGVVEVRRGKLTGAFDWDSEVTSDQRLKWPLELLWFGGPGPDRMHDRHEGGTTPIPANGRYFLPGVRHVIAVNAYNGTELWAREVGRGAPLTADDDTVYLNRSLWLKQGLCLALDARSGELKKVFGQPRPQQRFVLDQPQTFILKTGQGAYIEPLLRGSGGNIAKTTGVLVMRKAKDGLECILTTRAGRNEGWWLSFDFRPAAERTWFFGPKTFQYYISDSPEGNPRASQFVLEAPDAPKFRLKKNEDASMVFTLPWDELRRVLGGEPADFTFAACAIFKEMGRICSKFAPGYGGIVNDGWARIVLDPSREDKAKKVFPAPVCKLENVLERVRYCRLPKRSKKDNAPFRRTTLTGESAPIAYRRSWGCGDLIYSATMDFFRSGSLGFYDLEDDSGVRNFAGVRPGCGTPAMPALGIVIASEGDAGCACSYNFQTSVALAPTTERRNEDWAVYFENLRPGGRFQRLALNLGAPGDRRDNQRVLWLGYPRPCGDIQGVPLSVVLPVTVDGSTNLATWRFNADRTEVQGADRPWIYASGYRGLRRIGVDLGFHEAGVEAAAFPCDKPPEIDGSLRDSCWNGRGRLDAGSQNDPGVGRDTAELYFRHDVKELFIAFQRQLGPDRKGRNYPREKAATNEDASARIDDSLEIYISDETQAQCVHCEVSASGGRYNAIYKSALDPSTLELQWQKAAENAKGSGTWRSAVITNGDEMTVELAIPWAMFKESGLDMNHLTVNAQYCDEQTQLTQDALAFRSLVIRSATTMNTYTVRLHFAEPDEIKAGQRVFDVIAQGKTVFSGLDVAREAGGPRRALVKEIRGVPASDALTLEFAPKTNGNTGADLPILSGLEIVKE